MSTQCYVSMEQSDYNVNPMLCYMYQEYENVHPTVSYMDTKNRIMSVQCCVSGQELR
uniref:Uncharacterized protein n=1 Tax=Arion vulgaris TaxID=1028688 RepID=A0A0B6Y655_9EUPU